MPAQINPGMQQPPPISLAHAMLPSAQSDTPPPHVAPCGQHPTGPSPVSVTSTHVSPSWQQLLGKPMEEQLAVPLGQAHWRFSRKARAEAARRKRTQAGSGSAAAAAAAGAASCSSRPESTANGGRRDSLAEELAAKRRESSSSCALRAAIAAKGFTGAGAKTWSSGKAQYEWWNLAPWSGGILRIAVGRRWCCGCKSACARARASSCAVMRSHSEGGSGRISTGSAIGGAA